MVNQWVYGMIVLLMGLLLVNQNLKAQQLPQIDEEEIQIIYSHERMGTIIAHTQGIGLGYRWGRNTTAFRTRVYSVEFVNVKSLKQIHSINPYFGNAKRFVNGKMNEVFFLRGGLANKQLLNRKPLWGGIELRWLYEGGATVAFEKPYYLFIISYYEGIGNELNYTVETAQYDPAYDIYGRAPFTKGLDELSLKPGLYAKTGFNFEFGHVQTRIQSFEAGAILEFFPQSIEIMASDDNNRFFITLYINVSIGSRFNRF